MNIRRGEAVARFVRYTSGMDNASSSSALADYEATLPFALDPFQREAIAVLERGESVMVAAPTGTGKTAVAEFAVWAAQQRGGRVLYTTPVKSVEQPEVPRPPRPLW